MRYTDRTLTEPEEFRDVITGMELQVEFRRKPTRSSSIEQFQTVEWALDFGEAHPKLNFGGRIQGGWGGICIGLNGDDTSQSRCPVAPGTVSCLAPGEAVEGSTPPNYTWVTIALRPEKWAACRALAGGEENELSGVTTLTMPDFDRWAMRVRAIRQRLRAAAAPQAGAEHILDEGLDFAMSAATAACELANPRPPMRESFRNRARLARRAATWMRDRLSDPIHVPDVCLALRVSRRELEYAFRTVFDQSPRDFLHTIRLHAVRQDLLTCCTETSILDVTLAHGVQHAGRFAAEYRELFGESPIETKRSRQPSLRWHTHLLG